MVSGNRLDGTQMIRKWLITAHSNVKNWRTKLTCSDLNYYDDWGHAVECWNEDSHNGLTGSIDSLIPLIVQLDSSGRFGCLDWLRFFDHSVVPSHDLARLVDNLVAHVKKVTMWCLPWAHRQSPRINSTLWLVGLKFLYLESTFWSSDQVKTGSWKEVSACSPVVQNNMDNILDNNRQRGGEPLWRKIWICMSCFNRVWSREQ